MISLRFQDSPSVFYQKNSLEISEFTILGERHSGTTWLERLIKARLCVPLTWRFGSKHFIDSLNPNLMASASNTLFICITRNIYDWIGGFYKLPHHVNSSIVCSLDRFLLSEWKNEIFDINYFTHKPYKNIFDLRSSKLIFYLYFLPNIVDNMLIIRYEDLLIDPERLVSFISDEFSINKTSYKYSKYIIPRKKTHYKFISRISTIIDTNTDWSIENCYRYQIGSRS